ncbi:MAG TPA: hypothetical protein VEH05_15500 [Streptosporangiaceae bacterium]|nr:hypothetical protein [Streptosporangiaceae bacterium]
MSADERPPPGLGPAPPDAAGAAYRGLGGGPRRRNSTVLVRAMVAVLAVILLFGSLTHLAPAVRAGLREGMRGYWVVTGRNCSRKACLWIGKFVLPNGHTQAASVQYAGQIPAGVHVGSRIAGLYPGGGLVFPVTGSDLWISLVVAIALALLGLYWASHRFVVDFLRQRADSARLAAPLR